MSKDLANICDGWDYHPGPPIVRKIIGNDGRPKIQLRMDLGVFQMEPDGRPDGKRPYGKESLLEHYESLLVNHKQRHGSDQGFHIGPEDFGPLYQEALQYYHRYISLFQLGEYEGVLRDTQRNLRLLEFVSKYANPPEMAGALTQFRPYLLMMRARAQAHISLRHDDYTSALKVIERSIHDIREFYESTNKHDMIELSPELKILESMLSEIQATRPLSPKELLQRALDEAVRREDFERAAILRDKLKALERNNA